MIWLSAVVGFAGVTGYKILCLLRKFIGRNKVLCFVEDILLSVLYAIFSYWFMYKTSGGVVRGYNYIFFMGGTVIAYKLWGSKEWQSKE